MSLIDGWIFARWFEDKSSIMAKNWHATQLRSSRSRNDERGCLCSFSAVSAQAMENKSKTRCVVHRRFCSTPQKPFGESPERLHFWWLAQIFGKVRASPAHNVEQRTICRISQIGFDCLAFPKGGKYVSDCSLYYGLDWSSWSTSSSVRLWRRTKRHAPTSKQN